jgi:2-C-methyl-D-erythritol 2,4-cyclodiphosphate synthase
LQLLQQVGVRIGALGWQVVNVDATVVAQEPRLAAHVPEMARRLAQALNVDASQINIKAKTAEKFGPVGQGQAMEARAVALISRA